MGSKDFDHEYFCGYSVILDQNYGSKRRNFLSKKNNRSSTAGRLVKQQLHVAVTENVFVYFCFVKTAFSFRKKP